MPYTDYNPNADPNDPIRTAQGLAPTIVGGTQGTSGNPFYPSQASYTNPYDTLRSNFSNAGGFGGYLSNLVAANRKRAGVAAQLPFEQALGLNFWGGGGGGATPAGGISGGSGIPTTPSGYQLGAAPQSGQGAFGRVPGPIGAPNPFADLSSVFPGLSNTNAAASSALLSGLQGQLSPGTQKAIQDASAAWGIQTGMPGSGLAANKSLRDLGLTSEKVQHQALGDYGSLLGAISRTQTVDPALQAEIAALNAKLAAAPDPAQAQNYAQALFAAYLNQTRQSGGGGNQSRVPGNNWWDQVWQGLPLSPGMSPAGTGFIDTGKSYFDQPPPGTGGLGAPDVMSGFEEFLNPAFPGYDSGEFSGMDFGLPDFGP